MKFVDKLLGLIKQGFTNFINFFTGIFQWLFDLIAKPLQLLFLFFDGIFYFFTVLFSIVVKIVMIFVAIFQFIFAVIAGVFRTIFKWLTVSPSAGDVSFPNVSNQGFGVVMDLVQPTGLTTVVPMVAIAFLWFFFAIKMLGLFGGQVMISPFGRGGNNS